MSFPQLDNCSQCHRVFRKTQEDKCQECLEQDQELLKKTRGLLRRSRSQGGITLEDLATQAQCPPESVETFYYSSRFGMDADLLILTCSRCSEKVKGTDIEGKFCKPCTEDLKSEVGNEVLAKEALDAEAQSERERLTRLKDSGKNHYGLNRQKGVSDRDFFKF